MDFDLICQATWRVMSTASWPRGPPLHREGTRDGLVLLQLKLPIGGQPVVTIVFVVAAAAAAASHP